MGQEVLEKHYPKRMKIGGARFLRIDDGKGNIVWLRSTLRREVNHPNNEGRVFLIKAYAPGEAVLYSKFGGRTPAMAVLQEKLGKNSGWVIEVGQGEAGQGYAKRHLDPEKQKRWKQPSPPKRVSPVKGPISAMNIF